jgi:glycosyltransferase involved in cell wall biosynthesis
VGNQDNLNFILQKGIPFRKISIFRISNFIHKSHFIPPGERSDNPKDFLEFDTDKCEILLCISRLEKLKHVDHVILVVKHLSDRGRNVIALMVGDGSYRNNLVLMANQLGIVEKIKFCGNRDQEWISRVVPKVDVSISPLTGRALLETALGGAPTVAYDIDWHSEIIISNETGILVPYLDHVKMADSVEFLLNNPTLADALGKNLRNHALQNFNPDYAIKVQIDAYDALLG